MPLTCPKVSDVNFTPTVTALPSPESFTEFGSYGTAVAGVTEVPHSEHGQPTLTEIPSDGVSRLPLSSTARDSIVVDRYPCAIQV